MKIKIILFLILNFTLCQNGSALEYYLEGEYEKLNNNFDLALFNFYKALKLDSNSVIILNQIANCHQMNQDTTNARYFYTKAFYKSNYSLENGLEILDYLESIADNKNSRMVLDTLLKYYPLNIDLKYKSLRYLYLNKEYDELINEYKDIYLLDRDNKEIIPKLTDIGIALNKKKYLEKTLLTISSLDSVNIQPLLALAGLKIGEENYEDAISYIDKAYKISKEGSVLIDLIDLVYNLKMKNLVEKYLYIYEKNHGKSLSVQYLKLEFAINDKQYFYALKLIKELIISGEVGVDVLDKLILVTNELNDIDIAEKILVNQYLKDTKNIVFPLLLGEIGIIKNDRNQALEWYLKCLDIDKKNVNIKHIIANLSESLFKYELSDSIFKNILKNDSTDASGLNNYAYSLCERPNPDLKFALELSQKAIKLQPGNAAFLDTIGWIYYKLGNYNLAHKYILQSANLDNKSEIILYHLAEVYLKLNNKSKALNIFLEILELNPKNEIALKKIKELSYE
ncbi:MAG: hypothetical protein CMF96_09020 [Candidatus Marinimicrobia bacterium]|mgnify:CR=1 FL=1|nr:hypothetical protein [Candidatus Neomarinimicrobiota bacterium]|tara:strand:- start:3 stop:1535 length:1533 start_codon:yes stop_codon:yes gene_type:complete